MSIIRTAIAIFVAALNVLVIPSDASAFGRKSRAASTCCYTPCRPCQPAFSLHASLDAEGGVVQWSPDRAIPIPTQIGVTNLEQYSWTYTSAEYGFYLFDDQGRHIPHAFLTTPDLRTYTAIPHATLLDQPPLSVSAGVLQLGKKYTVVVTLRGKSACFHVTPVIFNNPASR